MKITPLLFIILCLFLACCNSDKSQQAKNNPVNSPKKNNKSAFLLPAQMVFSNENGDKIVSFDFAKRETLIIYDKEKETLSGFFSKKKNKTSYFTDKGDIIAEVSYTEAGFRLKNTDDQLLWEVKKTRDFIQISDKKPIVNTYDLSKTKNNAYKIHKAEKELGYAVLSNKNILIEGSGIKLRLANSQNHWAFPILLVRDISPEHKYILTAELLKYF